MPWFKWRRFRAQAGGSPLARWLAMVVLLPGLGGCYLVQATSGQLAVLAARRPIAEVVADPATPHDLKERLGYVRAAREFASRELGLPDNGSYRDYADLGRRYVVWNVFAAPRFAVEPVRWCFPVAGCVVYRGYFAEAAARRAASRLARRGHDTAVAGVAAYSTLGHFADPVLNTMLDWDDARLAGTLFHELAHQVLYVPGDSSFNEAFASVVEEEGVRRWLMQAGREEDLAGWQAQQMRAAGFSGLLLDTRERLRALYASGLPAPEMTYRKHRLFGELKSDYTRLRAAWGGYPGYDAWFDRTLGNADLVAVATYRRCVPGFRELLAAAGHDLPAFYELARQRSRLPVAERQRLLCGDR